MIEARPLVRAVLTTGALVVLLAAQWLLFASYVRREVAWAYARGFDQTMSLNAAYRTYVDIQQRGVKPGLGAALRRSPPTGVLLHLEAASMFMATGPSRLAALSVNWLHFALLQVAVVWALWATSRRWELAALGLGLLLSVRSPFYWAGGLADFRPDCAAFCLYGAFLAVVWRSDLFRRHGWSIAAGVVGALCVLSRSLTAVYLGGMLAAVFTVLAIRWQREPARRAEQGRQLRGIGLGAATLGLIALPVLALQARLLWNYYVVGHVTGPERAVRAAAMGFRSLVEALSFYPRSTLFDHAGGLFLGLSAVSLATLVLAHGRGDKAIAGNGRGAALVFGAALLVPLTILTADTAKSALVGGLLVLPILWLILAGCARAMEQAAPAVRRVLAVSVLAAGVAWQLVCLLGPAPGYAVQAIREVLRLHDDVARWSQARGWSSVMLLADRQRDYVPAIRVSAYERHGRFLLIEQANGRTVWSPRVEEVMEPLHRSQFVILTRPQPDAHYQFPFDATMAALYPRLRAYCRRNMVRLGTYHVPEEVVLYARAPDGRGGPPGSIDGPGDAR